MFYWPYPACRGRHVLCGMRQSIPSRSIASCGRCTHTLPFLGRGQTKTVPFSRRFIKNGMASLRIPPDDLQQINHGGHGTRTGAGIMDLRPAQNRLQFCSRQAYLNRLAACPSRPPPAKTRVLLARDFHAVAPAPRPRTDDSAVGPSTRNCAAPPRACHAVAPKR